MTAYTDSQMADACEQMALEADGYYAGKLSAAAARLRGVGEQPAVCLWGALWVQRACPGLHGDCSHLLRESGLPVIFKTRDDARKWIERTHGYIRERKDLRRYPHCWRVPRAVRIEIRPAPPTYPRQDER